MSNSIYKDMQAAVDIVNSSPHPTNKIAATIAGEGFTFSCTNHRPPAIETTIGTDTKIGNSSGTLHAETSCIIKALKEGQTTKDANIFITDPPCPNCMKNMAEAGIAKLYIDHKGFDKDWSKRRGESFENMSMRIAQKAGIDIYTIYRKEERFEIIWHHPADYKPAIENPAIIEACDDWEKTINTARINHKNEPFAIARAQDKTGEAIAIKVTRHPTIGYTDDTVEHNRGKYSFILEPLNRVIMTAAKEGLTLDPEHIYSSRVPTSRELINYVGAGFTKLQIGDTTKARDEHGPLALKQLSDAGVLNVQHKT